MRNALVDFSSGKKHVDPYENGIAPPQKRTEIKNLSIRPISGFTGFIPGAKSVVELSFARACDSVCCSITGRKDTGQSMPKKDLTGNKPISGYSGHRFYK